MFNINLRVNNILNMSFQTFYSSNSKISEKCLWLKEGKRYICITYEYYPITGHTIYAASIFRLENDQIEISVEQVKAHEHTTTKRFELRPVDGFMSSKLAYYDMIKEIRYKMCFGLGCVGPRKDKTGRESFSSVESISNSSMDSYGSHESDSLFQVSPRTHTIKTTKRFKYDILTREKNKDASFTYRSLFVTFKGLAQNGDVLYGACISNIPAYNEFDIYHEIDEEAHYATSLKRLNKSPVHMSIPKEFRHQLKRDSEHHEDVMYQIVDKIIKRKNGKFLVKG